MRARQKRGRLVDGVLVIDKPHGASSNEAVQRAKRLFAARKVGHTGNLDPLATGVLPLCFGEATKFSRYLLASDKRYWCRIQLGVATDSGDADGKVISETPGVLLERDEVEAALCHFRGPIKQVPSMYSAIKHQGQPLYKLARKGIEVEREARDAMIYSNELTAFDGKHLEIVIRCSKGTYVRSIATDLGERLGCGAHVTALRRLQAGPYREQDLVTFETLEAALPNGSLDPFLLPVSSAVQEWPEIRVNRHLAYYLQQGQPVLAPGSPSDGWVRIAMDEPDSRFLGVGEILDDGRIAPRRLMNH